MGKIRKKDVPIKQQKQIQNLGSGRDPEPGIESRLWLEQSERRETDSKMRLESLGGKPNHFCLHLSERKLTNRCLLQ